MSRRDMAEIVEHHGGLVVDFTSGPPDVVVVGDDAGEPRSAVRKALGSDNSAGWDAVDVVTESELWQRLGFVEEAVGVQRLYTPAMLAELLNVPIAAIRRWRRKGYLQATREVRRLPYFDFAEVQVARQLAALLHQGCSLATIDRQVTALERLMPEVVRPLAEPALVVEKGSVYWRRGDDLAEPSGQLLLDFSTVHEAVVGSSAAMPQSLAEVIRSGHRPAWLENQPTLEELRGLAIELQDTGDLAAAIEACRALLMAGGNEPEDHFALAELLYRASDLAAARERYFVAIELDETYVEARANLGCVLAELGELELAAASLVGALAYHSDFADAHYHLAQTLERLDRPAEAASHWRQFLELAPESPWAEEARDHLAATH
ncbi:MAG: tetratricopeptide repeat protein [Pirellulales bacterium]